MPDTRGFDLVTEIASKGILDILQGAWVSNILKKNIPVLPQSIGGIGIQSGQMQVGVAGVTMAPPPGTATPAGSIAIKFDIKAAQVQMSGPDMPLLSVE